jgi:hypothetical protein
MTPDARPTDNPAPRAPSDIRSDVTTDEVNVRAVTLTDETRTQWRIANENAERVLESGRRCNEALERIAAALEHLVAAHSRSEAQKGEVGR